MNLEAGEISPLFIKIINKVVDNTGYSVYNKEAKIINKVVEKGFCMEAQTRRVLFSSDKDFWETPQSLFDELNEKYHFTLDAAASDENHKCSRYFTKEDNGLLMDLGGTYGVLQSSVRQ